MHKIKNNPISSDDVVNKKYVDDNTTTKQDKTDNALDTTDKTVVGSINELNKNFMKSITFNDTNLTITYKNGKVTTVPLNDFISGIIAKANLFSMIVVDALPTVADNGDGTYTITYVQSGKSKTTKNENTWFLYNVKGTYKETMFVGTTEITRDAGSIDLSNYVNKLTDVISTWDFKDLTKIPTMASLKNGITDTINSSSTSTNIASAKGVYNELNKKANATDLTTHTSDTNIHVTTSDKTKWNNVDNKVDKTDITTTIDSSSTDSELPSARSIYYNCIEGIEINQTTIDTYGTEILKYPLGIWRINNYSITSKFTDLPIKKSGRIEITSINPNTNVNPWENQWSYRVYNFETINGENYIRKLESGNTAGVISRDTGWKRVCTTSVADVPPTNIAPADTTTFVDFKGNSSCNYYVKNGVCYVSLWGVKITSTGASKQTDVYLPKSANGRAGTLMTGNGDATAHAFAFIIDNGELCFDVKDTNISLFGSFSYPVKES